MQTIGRLLKYFRNYRTNVALNVVCNIFMVFFNIVSIPMLIPFLQILLGQQIPPTQKPNFQWSVKALTETFYYQLGHIIEVNGKEQALIYVCIGMVTIFFFKNVFRYLALFFIVPMLNGVVRDIRQDIFDKTLRLPLSYFSDERKGDLISRVTADVQEVLWSILNVIETIVREPLLIIGALSIMLYISPTLTGFVFVLLIFTGFIIGSIGKSLKKESTELQGKLGSLVSVLDEALGGSRVIKAFNGENYQQQKFATENNGFLQLLIKVARRRDLASPTTEFLGIAVVCILIWFGFKRVEIQELSPASFLAFLYAFFTVIEPAKAFSAASYNIRKGAGALDRIEEILNAEETIQDAEKTTDLPHFTDKIEYRNVSFSYKNGEKQILNNINLTIPKGKIVALVGASGAGKSTIADLLPRFYDVAVTPERDEATGIKGGIFIDGVNIKDLKVKDLRNFMGIVTQEAVLFNDTIYNNIVFGKTDVTIAEVEAAAKAANAHEFIQNTEGAYQTNIGDRGMKLSGGQRQRLTIARALLRNPEILILDEATSALDSESEKLVQEALTKLMRGRTALVIAHRLSTVQHADEIIVINDGQIVERGTHDALFKQGGAYRKLVELQGLH
jgi:ABC-type multidrug transport system fused ATPase/permease subunit